MHMSSERDNDDTADTEIETASGAEVPDTRRRRIGSDTIPDDARIEVHALLDRLLPTDGRARPPRAIAKQGASSGGGSYVAYSGEGRPAKASKTAEPVDAVVVMRELGDLAIAARTQDAITEPEGLLGVRQSLAKTEVVVRKRARRWPWVVACVVAGLVVLFLAVRS
jgi:hypothetical protein